jgi:hypothetical protein
MIKNNFNELVAQRKLKITRISNDTGISRPTLNALTRDDGKGIQYDTLNTLCNYFSITPCEFFSYIPFDIQYNFEIIDEFAKPLGQMVGIEYTLQKKALLFINVYDNKGIKKNTFEILYLVLTTYNTTVDIETDDFGEILDEVKGNSSKVILDEKQFENGDNEFILFLKEFEVQWQTKIIDDIIQYMSKDINKKIDGDFVSYLEANFNKYI